MRNQSRFSIIFLGTILKFCYEILMQNWGERIFSNQLLGMRFYTRVVVVMALE